MSGKTIWEMMGQAPPPVYQELRGEPDDIDPSDLIELADPIEEVRGAVDGMGLIDAPVRWQMVELPVAPSRDPLRIGDGDDSIVRRLKGFFWRFPLGSDRSEGESDEA